MAERPIIFSAPMVRALLDGRKTQTRRVLRPRGQQREWANFGACPSARIIGDSVQFDHPRGGPYTCARLPYAVGDRLWVRESGWERPERTARMLRDGADTWEPFYYDADGIDEQERDELREWGFKRRPSIHMPRWASRLTLTVTEVRVQRLQEISEEDARAEGIERDCGDGCCWRNPADMEMSHFGEVQAFKALWSTLHGPGAWDANPWVCALTFTVERRNIDAGAG